MIYSIKMRYLLDRTAPPWKLRGESNAPKR